MATSTAALGGGPVVIYTSTQTQVEVPLSAISFSGNTPQVDSAYAAFNAVLQPWLKYLVATGQLRPGTAPPLQPAMIIKAADAGSSGNNIQVIVAPDPNAAGELEITVTEIETYAGLTPATMKAIVGTPAAPGQKPGLVKVLDTAITMPNAMPATKLGTGTGVVGDATKKATLPVAGAAGTAFTLEAKKVGADGNKTEATVTPDSGGTSFTLVVTWIAKVSGIKASDVPTLDTKLASLGYEIVVSKPSTGFALPQPGTVTLSGGIDPATASQSAVASS